MCPRSDCSARTIALDLAFGSSPQRGRYGKGAVDSAVLRPRTILPAVLVAAIACAQSEQSTTTDASDTASSSDPADPGTEGGDGNSNVDDDGRNDGDGGRDDDGLGGDDDGHDSDDDGRDDAPGNGDDDDGGDDDPDNGDRDPVANGRPSGVFGGGPLYHDSETVLPRLKASGFDTVIFWSVHISQEGNLVLNDTLIVENGEYVGNPDWPAQVVDLEAEPTSVVRTEFSVGAWGVPDFDNIGALIEAEGYGEDSTLYRNFAALKAAIPTIDAINYDDETYYQANPTIAFSLLLNDLGYKVTFAPYTQQDFWISVYEYLERVQPGLVDRVLLQKYAGGAANNPATWAEAFDGVEVEVGLWSLHGDACTAGDTPQEVATKLQSYGNASVGGWLWLLDDLLACDKIVPLEEYAAAIDGVYGD